MEVQQNDASEGDRETVGNGEYTALNLTQSLPDIADRTDVPKNSFGKGATKIAPGQYMNTTKPSPKFAEVAPSDYEVVSTS